MGNPYLPKSDEQLAKILISLFNNYQLTFEEPLKASVIEGVLNAELEKQQAHFVATRLTDLQVNEIYRLKKALKSVKKS